MQDVGNRECRVGRFSNIEQSGDSIRFQLLPPSWRPGYFLKLALLKMVLKEIKKVQRRHTLNKDNGKPKDNNMNYRYYDKGLKIDN